MHGSQSDLRDASSSYVKEERIEEVHFCVQVKEIEIDKSLHLTPIYPLCRSQPTGPKKKKKRNTAKINGLYINIYELKSHFVY